MSKRDLNNYLKAMKQPSRYSVEDKSNIEGRTGAKVLLFRVFKISKETDFVRILGWAREVRWCG